MIKKVKRKAFDVYKFVNARLWLFTLLATAVIVATGIFISIESNRLIASNSDSGSHYTLEPNNSLKFLANWDGADYIRIASVGYDGKFFTGFFPLYPILIRIVHIIISSYLISGLIVAWLGFWGALYFYFKVVMEYYSNTKDKIFDNLTLLKASLYFVLFPSGIYLLSVYTESLYAFFALSAIYFAMKKKVWISSALTLLSTATHITGFFLIPLIMLILLEEKVDKIKILLSGIIGSLGILSYSFYLFIKFHNPYEFIHSQTVHHWLKNKIWFNFSSASVLDVFILISLITAVFYWYKRKKSFSFYTLLFVAIPIVGGQFDGFARYSIMAFPVQLMFFDYLRNRLEAQFASLMILSSLWTYSVILFAAGFVTH